MGVAERRARGKEALRQSILNAAIELIVAEGFGNLSIRKIADKIEYAPSTIYLYFKDKYEIVSTICEETFNDLTAELQRITEQHDDPVIALRAGLRAYIDFGISHPSHYLVTFCTPAPPLPDDHPSSKFDAGLRCYQFLIDGLAKCVAAGRMLDLDLHLLSQTVWSSIHGLTSILVTYGDAPHFPWVPREVLIENLLSVTLRGILIHPEEFPLQS